MGKASVTPANAAKQPDVYPKGKAASVYCFDPDIYDDFFLMKLKYTLTQVGVLGDVDWCCITGIRELHNIGKHVTNLCIHRSLFQNKGSSNYLSDNVEPCNVVTEHIKGVKTSRAFKCNLYCLVCFICFCCK